MVRKGTVSDKKYRQYRRKEYANRRQLRLNIIDKLGCVCKHPECNETEDLVIDHIVPIKCNGNRCHTWKDLNNLQVLCSPHNLEKGKTVIRY